MGIAAKTMDIAEQDGGSQPVRLSYLEHESDSHDLVVFLHGLGLDADDYYGYLAHADLHAVALTLPGFEPADAAPCGQTIGVDRHARLISTFIGRIREASPDKRFVLVGFSIGADMVLRVAELWGDSVVDTPKLHAALLLDPNVNHATMTISRIFAKADPKDPLPEMLQVAQLAGNMVEFRSLCQYLLRVSTKDFPQVKRLARDFVDYWEPAGHYDLLTRRLSILASLADHVRVVLSAAYKPHVAPICAAARSTGIDNAEFELTDLDHFQLIDEDRLRTALTAVR